MLHQKLSALLAAFCLTTSVLGAPIILTRKQQDDDLSNGRAADNSGTPLQPVGPAGSSGNVYGSSSLLGPAGDSAPDSFPGLPNSAGPTDKLVGQYTSAPGEGADPDLGLFLDFAGNPNPQPIRGENGATDPGPRNEALQQQNSDLLIQPGTDAGDVPNAKWPMALSSTRSGTGGGNPGWARQENTDELPIATTMAGVDMRLGPNAYRELHWHSANEWAYIFAGGVRISSVNQDGETFVDDLQAGDLW